MMSYSPSKHTGMHVNTLVHTRMHTGIAVKMAEMPIRCYVIKRVIKSNYSVIPILYIKMHT